jgi:FkbM family methyltransferase
MTMAQSRLRMQQAKDATKRVLRRIGLDIGMYRNTLAGARDELLCIEVDLVIDVGAHAGEYGNALRAAGYKGRIMSFEPIRSHFERLAVFALADKEWECHCKGIGAHAGAATINVSGNDGFSSSLLPMNRAHESAVAESRYQGTEEIEIVTLDEWLVDSGRGARSTYLKVDAQGYEHEVLAGAKASLMACLAVELELSLTRLYEGQLLIGDMLDLMRQYGFIPTHLEPEFVDPHTGEILQVNCLFRSVTA